jgi:hypothetical protein
LVQVGLGKKQDPISKTTRVKRAGCVVQVVRVSAFQLKDLSSNPSTNKKKIFFKWKKETRKKRGGKVREERET